MAYTGKRFIRKATSPTVYMREGRALRPIQSIDEFQMLSGTRNVDEVTDIVDNLDEFNLNPQVGENERATYLNNARGRYAGTRKQFADLIGGKLSQEDLDFTDAKTRINRGAEDAITGAAQDLSSRGFLRSGEQIDRTVRSKEEASTNIGRADIQRQINRANLLLEQTQFENELEKTAIAEADQDVSREYDTRAAEQNRLAQAWDTSMALQASREEREFKREMLKAELAKAKAASGGTSMPGLADMIAYLNSQGMSVGGPGGESDFTEEEIALISKETPEQKQARVDLLTSEGERFKRQAKIYGGIANVADQAQKIIPYSSQIKAGVTGAKKLYGKAKKKVGR